VRGCGKAETRKIDGSSNLVELRRVWATDNKTPFGCDRTWLRDKTGAHIWIEGVRATFDIKSGGKLVPAEEQPPPLLAPEWNGEDGLSSLRYEADLMAMKPGTDVLVNGRAHAPGGKPATEVPISLRCGQVRKVLLARGPNVFHSGGAGLSTTSPSPFTTMDVVYERAFGGMDLESPDPKQQKMDPRNPVGVGVASSRAKVVNKPGPNIVYPGKDIESAGPAGFGPIACHWSPRLELAGTYDKAWEKTRKPLLPDDWNPRCLLCSPPDQRTGGYLQGGEPVEVVNMSPSGVVRFEIPRRDFTFVTRFGKKEREYGGLLTTVIVEPEHPRVICVWLSQLLVSPPDLDYLDVTEVKERAASQH
jgi:hypothetical protein